ncbi:MAG: GNAT family N-acetyltransferase [Bifidobacterium sp.]|nr:GNAT family N-acetyltransferase [Bifidobacterium sp.]MCI1225526.1 GNAT family N-acetyltransferase [Bifidobacterium sp.]
MKFPANEHGFENDAAGMSGEEFVRYLHALERMSAGIGIKPTWVPGTKYILVNDDGDYVGIVNLRQRLNDKLREGAGHIGYGIAPEYRGRGYATQGLRLVLEKAKALGIDEAYLAVHKDNLASLAVQRHLGARIDHEDDEEYYTRIALG